MSTFTKHIVFSMLLFINNLLIVTAVQAQTIKEITLEQCYGLAIQNSTLNDQRYFRSKIRDSQLKAANSEFIPSLTLNGSTSYQSDVVEIPISSLPFARKEQYNLSLELEQLIFNGRDSHHRKEIANIALKVEEFRIDISELELKNQIANLFLEIILLAERIKICTLYSETLSDNIQQLQHLNYGGIALKSDLSVLHAKRLDLEQQLITLQSERNKQIDILSILVGTTLSNFLTFKLPYENIEILNTVSYRPEFNLFNKQQEIIHKEMQLIDSRNLPHLSLFTNGGNGLPGLNPLSRNPAWFYILGARVSIPITQWTTTRYEKRILSQKRSLIQLQKEDFKRNNQIQIVSCIREIEKIRQLLPKDDAIIEQRARIVESEFKRLQGGIITSTDYLTQVHAYQTALLNKNINKIRLNLAIIDYKYLTGNQ